MAANSDNIYHNDHEWVELGRGLKGSGIAAESFTVTVYKCNQCGLVEGIERYVTAEESNILKELVHNASLTFNI